MFPVNVIVLTVDPSVTTVNPNVTLELVSALFGMLLKLVPVKVGLAADATL